ncbi:AraC family transcriptional regulator [Agarivorans sp. TSD2052]|uniref:AraC family transcriptional regulator n=1 Tax=Agarivorans sp. TSD2052 TaxID=2937286 RepID=UPI002010BF2B|nr:AraC family transcriptional regulator [Agarivorans sp. TSD2052]UPW17270.1 AraC family transcriptional regulator [Agarivorans sp. TSD2052]
MQQYLFQLAALKSIVELAELQGLDKHRLLAAADISPSVLRRDSGLVNQLNIAKFFTAVDHYGEQPLGSACCGLTLALRKQGAVAVAIQHMPNLAAMVLMLQAFLNAQSSGTCLSLSEQGDLVRVEFSLKFADQLNCDAMYRAMLCNLFSTFKQLLGDSWHPRELWLDHPFSHANELSDLLKCPLKTQMPSNGIVFDKRWSHVTGAQVFPISRELSKQNAAAIDRLDNIEDLIYQLLPALIYDGRTSIEQVAELFGVQVRVLQKRLKAKDTRYSSLLEDARKTMAIDYLLDSQLSISDISLQLGYREPAIFIRCFKKWFKQTPLQWRKIARAN